VDEAAAVAGQPDVRDPGAGAHPLQHQQLLPGARQRTPDRPRPALEPRDPTALHAVHSRRGRPPH